MRSGIKVELVQDSFVRPTLSTPTYVTAVAYVILMCYGGGFGTMPAFTADYFGSKNVGPIYGLMLTAWGCASAFGPLIAHLLQSTGSYASGLHAIAIVMLVSIVGPIIVRPPKPGEPDKTQDASPQRIAS